MEREHIYNASNPDGTLNAVIRWNIGGVDLVVDGKRKANALQFHGYRSATLNAQRQLNQTVECLLSLLTPDTLKDGLKWVISCFPWTREVQTLYKTKGETTNAEGTQIKWYAVFSEEKLTVSLSGANFKLVNVRRSYTTPPTQQEMQDIITDVQQLLNLPFNEALQNIRLLFHSDKYECFKRPEPQPKRDKPEPQPKREKPKPKQDKPKREKPKPKQEQTVFQPRYTQRTQEKDVMKTKEVLNETINEVFPDDDRGEEMTGWVVYAHYQKDSYSLRVNFRLPKLLDEEDEDKVRRIGVCFTLGKLDGPIDEWKNDVTELLKRIRDEFTGDVQKTLLRLHSLTLQKPSPSQRTAEEFEDDISELNLYRFKHYARQVTWDEWEIRMMAEEQERKNKKTTIKTDGTEKERTKSN